MTAAQEFRDCDVQQTIQQIGRMNLLAISGGRIIRRDTGITLPVGAGYSVTVDLDWGDDYVVRRVFKRGAKVWIKGEQRGVYCDEVGEVAYRASSFRSYEFGGAGVAVNTTTTITVPLAYADGSDNANLAYWLVGNMPDNPDSTREIKDLIEGLFRDLDKDDQADVLRRLARN